MGGEFHDVEEMFVTRMFVTGIFATRFLIANMIRWAGLRFMKVDDSNVSAQDI